MKKNMIVLCLALLALLAAVVCGVEYESSFIQITLQNQEPNPARAGDVVELRFRIENLGGQSVENFEMEVMPNYPFVIVDGPALKSLGMIYPYQTSKSYINTEFKVKIDKEAVKGKYDLKVRYQQKGGIGVTTSFTIDITSKEFAQIIYIDKAKIDPGKETPMKFTIINTGSAPLQNLIFSWSEQNGVLLPVFSDDTKYIKYLDIGDSVDLNYTIIADVNAKPGLYSLDLNLKYESSGNITATIIKTKAGIFVGGETSFDVAFSESTQGQTSLSVSNTGNNPALSVSVRIPEQDDFRVSGSSSAIIGNLDKGDYTIVSFQIAQNMRINATERGGLWSQSSRRMQNATDRANRDNDLKVIIDYTDTTGQRRSVEKDIPIQFRGLSENSEVFSGQFQRRQQQSAWSGNWGYGIVLVILLMGVLFFHKPLREKLLENIKKMRGNK